MVGQFVVLPWRHARQLAATAAPHAGSQVLHVTPLLQTASRQHGKLPIASLCKTLVTEVPWQEAWHLLLKLLLSLLIHTFAIHTEQGKHFHGINVWLIETKYPVLLIPDWPSLVASWENRDYWGYHGVLELRCPPGERHIALEPHPQALTDPCCAGGSSRRQELAGCPDGVAAEEHAAPLPAEAAAHRGPDREAGAARLGRPLARLPQAGRVPPLRGTCSPTAARRHPKNPTLQIVHHSLSVCRSLQQCIGMYTQTSIIHCGFMKTVLFLRSAKK